MTGTQAVEKALALYESKYVVIKVNGNAFKAAKQLERRGLEVDYVLGPTRVVMGECAAPLFEHVVKAKCVVSYELDEGKK